MKPQIPRSQRRNARRFAAATMATFALVIGGAVSAQAYNAGPDVIVELGTTQACLKGRGNCIIYPKTTQLPSGRLIAAFEKATVGPTGSADNTKMPVYKSDDLGASWQPLAEVAAPAYLSDDAKFAPYVSNWTNPNLYVLPQDIGGLAKGTLLLSTVVSGEDEYYVQRKAADPNWTPTNDGDRRDIAIAMFASSDEGATWTVVDIIARGGWQGGSAGNIGGAIADVNVNRQVDPVWEPHLMVRDDMLVAYYSDENDFLDYDATTGIARMDPDNQTAADSHGQVLVHRTWTGSGEWSEPVIDVAGLKVDRGNGKTQIGGGRPGMTTVAETTDDKWMMTFEYFGGGSVGRVKFADDPLRFFADGTPAGDGVGSLPVTNGSGPLWGGGSPVTVSLPDGRIIYNADGSGDIWVNESGRSDGAWIQRQTPLGSGYSRNMQYVEGSGLVHILQAVWGGATSGAVIRSADVDLGHSDGPYVSLENRKTGQRLGTGGNTTDVRIGNGDQPDVRVETPRLDASAATQLWQVRPDLDDTVTLLNKSGGREASIWWAQPVQGQRIASWVDDTDGGMYRLVERDGGYVAFQAARNSDLYLTASAADEFVTLQPATDDGSQEWKLTPEATDGENVEVTPTVSSAEGASADGWHRGAASVTFSTIAGAVVQYRLEGTAEWTDAVDAVTVATQGVTTVEYRAVRGDAVIEGTPGSVQVKVDSIAPVTSATTDPVSGTAPVGGRVTAVFTASDSTSGVARTEYSIDGGVTWNAGTEVSFTEVGSHPVSYRSVDAAGNVEAARTVTVTVAGGATAKVTITSAEAPTVDGWYRQNVLVSLQAASAGQKVQYRVNGGAWKQYRSAVTVSTNGASEIEHRLIASNVVVAGSEARTLVKLDKRVPIVAAEREPSTGNGTVKNPITVVFTGADTLSGLDKVEYRVNGGGWTTATAEALTLAEVGDWVVSYRALDKAGNVSATKTVTAVIGVDVAPIVKASAKSVRAGAAVTFSVAGFARWDDVTLTFRGQSLTTLLTDVDGTGRVTVRLPADAVSGDAVVLATGTDGTSTETKLTVKR